MSISVGITPVNYIELKKKWESLLKRVKTEEDFNKLSDEEKKTFLTCNVIFAPSWTLKSTKGA